jgi:hypothetical protein
MRPGPSSSCLIHPSAWKGNSANFTLMELGIFARVPPKYPVRGFTEGERKPRAGPPLYRALALLCRLWANFAFTEFSEVRLSRILRTLPVILGSPHSPGPTPWAHRTQLSFLQVHPDFCSDRAVRSSTVERIRRFC